MKKRKKLYTTLLLALAIVTLSGFTYGCRSFFSADERIDHVTKKISKKLNLDSGQKEVLQSIAVDVKAKIQELRANRDQRHGRLPALIKQDQITREDMLDLMAGHRQTFDDMAEFTTEQFIRFHSSLNEDQREKLALAIEEHATKDRHCRFMK